MLAIVNGDCGRRRERDRNKAQLGCDARKHQSLLAYSSNLRTNFRGSIGSTASVCRQFRIRSKFLQDVARNNTARAIHSVLLIWFESSMRRVSSPLMDEQTSCCLSNFRRRYQLRPHALTKEPH